MNQIIYLQRVSSILHYCGWKMKTGVLTLDEGRIKALTPEPVDSSINQFFCHKSSLDSAVSWQGPRKSYVMYAWKLYPEDSSERRPK